MRVRIVSALLRKLFSSVENWKKKNSPDMDVNSFKNLMNLDPTYQGYYNTETVGKYAGWLLRMLKKAKEAYPTLGDSDVIFSWAKNMDLKGVLHKYHVLSKRKVLPKEYKDINVFKTVGDLSEFMEGSGEEIFKKIQEKDVEKQTEKVYEDKDWLVVSPKSHAAAVKWSWGFKDPKKNPDAKKFPWCICADSKDGETFFENYTDRGPALIWLNKHNPEEGYATVAGAQPHEIRDANNNRNLSQGEWYHIFPEDAIRAAAKYDKEFLKWFGVGHYSDEDDVADAVKTGIVLEADLEELNWVAYTEFLKENKNYSFKPSTYALEYEDATREIVPVTEEAYHKLADVAWEHMINYDNGYSWGYNNPGDYADEFEENPKEPAGKNEEGEPEWTEDQRVEAGQICERNNVDEAVNEVVRLAKSYGSFTGLRNFEGWEESWKEIREDNVDEVQLARDILTHQDDLQYDYPETYDELFPPHIVEIMIKNRPELQKKWDTIEEKLKGFYKLSEEIEDMEEDE